MTRAILVLALLVAALPACSPVRVYEAARVLADVAAGPGPSGLKESAPPPLRIPVGYDVGGRARAGDLYLPDERAGGARLVLVPGAAEAGKDDPRMVAFAETLARARFTVLVPDIASMRALQVNAGNARDIADAVLWLGRRDDGPPAPVGIVAISYGVGPAVLAALDPAAGLQIRFILGIGGYYGIEAAVTYFTTGMYRDGPAAPWRHRGPNAYGRWVFVLANAGRLEDRRDADLLRAIGQRKLRDPTAEIADLSQRLGPEGGAVEALLRNTDPERVPALIAGLPAPIRADMTALDLKQHDLSRLSAKLFLLHGRDDGIIPFTESRALAAAAPDAALYLVDGLAHVDLGPGGLGDTLTLLELGYDLLTQRDAMAP